MLDELERVRAYRADVPEPDDVTILAARAELLDAIRREPRRDAQTTRVGAAPAQAAAAAPVRARGCARGGRGRPRRRARTGTAAAPQSALAAEMNQLAKVAASQAWTGIPGPGQYLYTESEGLTDADTGAADKECTIQLVEHRASLDGDGRVRGAQ